MRDTHADEHDDIDGHEHERDTRGRDEHDARNEVDDAGGCSASELRDRVERYMARGRAPDWWYNRDVMDRHLKSWSSSALRFWESPHWLPSPKWVRDRPTDPSRRGVLQELWGPPDEDDDGDTVRLSLELPLVFR